MICISMRHIKYLKTLKSLFAKMKAGLKYKNSMIMGLKMSDVQQVF